MADWKNIVAVDLDGTITRYQGFVSDEHIDDPVELEVIRLELEKMRCAGWYIIIWTTRRNEDAVRAYLAKHDIPFDEINNNSAWAFAEGMRKIPATVYIDDRGITFNGMWEGMADKVIAFKTWWEREKEIEESFETK